MLSAAEVSTVPVSGNGWNQGVIVNGKTFPDPKGGAKSSLLNRVGPGYLRTMGTPLLAGRDFDERDTVGPEKAVIVTQLFAQKYFPGRNPIGQVFQIDERPGNPQPLHRIVGLVRDTKYTDLREDFTPLVFYAASQDEKPDPYLQVVMRSTAPLTSITSQVTSIVGRMNSNIIVQFQTLPAMVRDSLLRERLMATLSGFFGALAALIAAIGLYGVMSYTVARRRNEIGIRMALGADRRDVVRMVMREAGLLLGAGLLVGGVMAVLAARTAATLLFGLKPGDPSTLAMSALALAAVAMLASYLPAVRASRLEPTEALREE